ncbi:MAG: tRNA (guanosine(37)-N1)-methyltransferase TrmD [Pseudomonadales bacterium]|nr:tRNA (guanosine(37)-N1)-methyltransferase TrmD [Pseudomonadales bacterium]
MNIGVVSLFPDMFRAISDFGVVGRALKQGIVNLDIANPRDFAEDRHKTVDDKPFGGGPGMLMKVLPLEKACAALQNRLMLASGAANLTNLEETLAPKKVRTIFVSPQGRPFSQTRARELAQHEHLLFVAGRYEGVDERFLDKVVDEELSLGDYVLSGGELAVMVMIDAIARMLPEVLGNSDSIVKESFQSNLLEGAQYTRPRQLPETGLNGSNQSAKAYTVVPDVLLSGDHEKVRLWELQASLVRTFQRRPDLLVADGLTEEERKLLSVYLKKQRSSV